jgi:indolepyruvate decarboxylase
VKVPTHREKIAMITIGEYLFQCLHNLGVNHIFQVPGDYVLDLMDVLLEGPIELVCTCNELNAGYAADAYAPVEGMGAVCVTYGVGGFSLVNAVVGAYAERVPLVVISGASDRSIRRDNLLLHHTTGDYNLQFSIMEKATVASVILTNSAQQPVKSIKLQQLVCITNVLCISNSRDLVYRPCIPSGKSNLFNR